MANYQNIPSDRLIDNSRALTQAARGRFVTIMAFTASLPGQTRRTTSQALHDVLENNRPTQIELEALYAELEHNKRLGDDKYRDWVTRMSIFINPLVLLLKTESNRRSAILLAELLLHIVEPTDKQVLDYLRDEMENGVTSPWDKKMLVWKMLLILGDRDNEVYIAVVNSLNNGDKLDPEMFLLGFENASSIDTAEAWARLYLDRKVDILPFYKYLHTIASNPNAIIVAGKLIQEYVEAYGPLQGLAPYYNDES